MAVSSPCCRAFAAAAAAVWRWASLPHAWTLAGVVAVPVTMTSFADASSSAALVAAWRDPFLSSCSQAQEASQTPGSAAAAAAAAAAAVGVVGGGVGGRVAAGPRCHKRCPAVAVILHTDQCVCVCLSVCLCARVRVRACVCVRVFMPRSLDLSRPLSLDLSTSFLTTLACSEKYLTIPLSLSRLARVWIHGV